MSVLISILLVLNSLVSGIGTILIFFGMLGYIFGVVFLGVFLVILTSALDVFTIAHQDKKKIEKIEVINNIGSQFAFPVISFVLYFALGDRYLLLLSLALAIPAFFKVAATTIKVYLFENKMY